MDETELKAAAHDVEVTVWVGKAGIEAVGDELADQLADRDLVKVKFLRSARGGSSATADLAERLADRADATLVETRGHTAVYH